jgi:transposase
MSRRQVLLTQEQHLELLKIRDHDPASYVRIKAGAILKLASGWSIRRLAALGLHKPYHEDTVRNWLNRYLDEGASGLRVKPGRGRKPVFSPCA